MRILASRTTFLDFFNTLIFISSQHYIIILVGRQTNMYLKQHGT